MSFLICQTLTTIQQTWQKHALIHFCFIWQIFISHHKQFSLYQYFHILLVLHLLFAKQSTNIYNLYQYTFNITISNLSIYILNSQNNFCFTKCWIIFNILFILLIYFHDILLLLIKYLHLCVNIFPSATTAVLLYFSTFFQYLLLCFLRG